MNLLVFVTVILMVLTSMSYGSLKVYFMQTLAQEAWMHYMEAHEECAYSVVINKIYDALPKKKGEKPPEKDSTGKPIEDPKEQSQAVKNKNYIDASPWINFKVLTGAAELSQNESDLYKEVFKRLLNNIYGDKKFFIQALEERPAIVDELIEFLHSKKDDIKKAQQFGNLKVSDSELKEFFYMITRYTPEESKKSACAEVSIMDYISDTSKIKISVYRTPRRILLALFGKEEVVDQIIKDREQLFKDVKRDNNPMDVAEAKAQFEGTYGGMTDFRDILDFTVNKTDPKMFK